MAEGLEALQSLSSNPNVDTAPKEPQIDAQVRAQSEDRAAQCHGVRWRLGEKRELLSEAAAFRGFRL